MIQFHFPVKLKVNMQEHSGLCREAAAIKKYIFIKESRELAGGREQPSTKGKVCDKHLFSFQ